MKDQGAVKFHQACLQHSIFTLESRVIIRGDLNWDCGRQRSIKP